MKQLINENEKLDLYINNGLISTLQKTGGAENTIVCWMYWQVGFL